MRTRNILDIPNHPTIPSIKRKAQVRKTDIHYENGSVEMVINIFNYLDEVELPDMFRQVILSASNDIMINPINFRQVGADSEGSYPSGSVGEFDCLFDIVDKKKKTNFELEEMYIGLRIDEINDKLYPKKQQI